MAQTNLKYYMGNPVATETWSMLKPLSVLNKAVGNRVIVELRGRLEYRGVLDGYDPHMNLVLKGAEELVDGELVRNHESTILRGDSVIYIAT
jgi:small nuclear ribonucleoprotein